MSAQLIGIRELIACMPGHVRARLADEIRRIDTPEAMATHAEALKAIEHFDARDRQLAARARSLFGRRL